MVNEAVKRRAGCHCKPAPGRLEHRYLTSTFFQILTKSKKSFGKNGALIPHCWVLIRSELSEKNPNRYDRLQAHENAAVDHQPVLY